MTCILIVEDDPDLAEFMAITLRTAGHECHVAHDGVETLLALRQFRHELLVVDIMLPDIVGLWSLALFYGGSCERRAGIPALKQRRRGPGGGRGRVSVASW